ncbi:MAG: hypothetical protein V2B20_11265 [Pseudomonadota bacterium]
MKIRSASGDLVQDELRDDLSMVVKTDKGLVVVLGCAHAGLINILTHVTTMLPGIPVHMVVGGTHLGFASPEQFSYRRHQGTQSRADSRARCQDGMPCHRDRRGGGYCRYGWSVAVCYPAGLSLKLFLNHTISAITAAGYLSI